MRLAIPLAAAALTACTPNPPESDIAAPAAALDCFRENGHAMLAAHRAGPAPGYPENALSSLARLAATGVLYAEIDVRRSADGTLFLLHDDTLERTTAGAGPAGIRDWTDLDTIALRDPAGTIVDDTIPTLAEAFAIAQETGLVLNLDLKSVPAEAIVDAIHRHDARDHVAVIAYSVEQAAAIHALDPGLVLSAPNDPDALAAAGVNLDAVYLWLGVGAADPAEDARLAAQGLETSAGLFALEDGGFDVYRNADAGGVELLSIDDVETAIAALGGSGTLQAQIRACTP
ncbi:glycerophosphodiester phosphodiesterase family protein [Maricaulis sp.]|uniref:glycerophosphodiester phosphodiesterase family protein n=1 Tax=Maricaulis sp. TaxID=1486257 RepID=UPI002618A969|nr:glycerophosphodiester phosphodiesterase family protein [Maricaulis sp.]